MTVPAATERMIHLRVLLKGELHQLSTSDIQISKFIVFVADSLDKSCDATKACVWR